MLGLVYQNFAEEISDPKLCLLNPITYGGGVLKTRIAFDALLDPVRVKIERQYFLTIPKYTYRSV